VSRRVVLTSASLLERRSGDYEVADRAALGTICALVRFATEPQWLGIEWADGKPPAMYITPARDAMLAAVLDAAQV
jgi:DnaJ homolog subfamily C member 13